jgi:protein required for attachment to host cells
MHPNTWILVADASRARLFAIGSKVNHWSLRKEFAHPASAAKVSEILTDKAGRVQQRMATGKRSAVETPTSPKETEAKRFAHELAAELVREHGRNSYSRLVLVAAPQFLGLLRACISAPVMKCVVATVHKDLTHVPERELPERLRDEI